jgi:tetratricopeptide (TPR) repeat protein
MDAPAGISPDLWNKYANLLSASAGLVATCSENVYKDLLFKYDSVLLAASADADLELPAGQAQRDRESFIEALEALLSGRKADWIMRRQWDEQLNYYSALAHADETNELVWYLQSFYHYMLGEGKEAASCLRRSFATCVLSGDGDPLGTRYRFLAAVHALNGEKELALHTYGITCVTDEERVHYERLLHAFEQGAVLYALGEMLARTGDLRTASRLLAKSRVDRALPLLKSIAVQTGDVMRALSLPAAPGTDRRQLTAESSMNERLNGLRHLMQADRRVAMRCFWRGSTLGDISPELLELEAIDSALAVMSAAEPLPV